MLLLTTLPLILLSACALAAPPPPLPDFKLLDPSKTAETQPSDPSETKPKKTLNWYNIVRLSKLPPKNQPEYEPNPDAPPPVNATELALRPKTTCTYQVNYKQNTYYIFGDNWNATKDEIKNSCEKGRLLNHWSFREWNDDSGAHFCAKVGFC